VHDPHTYDVVSRDIMQRWTFPLVPDANLLPDCTYRCTAHCVYEERLPALDLNPGRSECIYWLAGLVPLL
jgi:hypothetical protein